MKIFLTILVAYSFAGAEIYNCQGTYQNSPCKSGGGEEVNLPEISRVSTPETKAGARARLAPQSIEPAAVPQPEKSAPEKSLEQKLDEISRQISKAKDELRGENKTVRFAAKARLENEVRKACSSEPTNRDCKELLIEARSVTR